MGEVLSIVSYATQSWIMFLPFSDLFARSPNFRIDMKHVE